MIFFQIQFMFLIIIYGQLLFQSDCPYPKFPVVLLLAQDIFIFSLFLDFYIKTYIKSKPAPKVEGHKNGENGTSLNGFAKFDTDIKTKNE